MLFELHAHTSRHSRCSTIDPVTLVRQTVRKGLQGLVLTEHHYLWPAEEIERLRSESEVQGHFVILSAQEVDTDRGHVLVYGAAATIPERTALERLRELHPEAALIWAHPFRNGKIPSKDDLLNPLFNAIEIISLNHTAQENYRGLKAWHDLKFIAVSGSDTHASGKAGVFPTYFDHPVRDIRELAGEIRAGRCHPFLKEIPKAGSDILVTEVTIGTKGDDEQRERIIVKNIADPAKWRITVESAHITEALYDHGFKQGPFRVPKIIETDETDHILIEEGQRGKNLFDILSSVSRDDGMKYFTLAAEWLARLHSLKLRIGSVKALREREFYRFSSYERAFVSTGNPGTETIRSAIAFVRDREEKLFSGNDAHFVQLHGDYHPKNILIGRDRSHDASTLFVSVIDFNNSFLFLPAFDVGYFLAQFTSQFFRSPDVLSRYTSDVFTGRYREASASLPVDFGRQVDLFTLRGYLSIAAFLVRVGKGESGELNFVLSNARALMESLSS